MPYRSISRTVLFGLLTVIVAVAFPGASRAEDRVLQGSDLEETLQFDLPSQAASLLLGPIRFKGEPIGSYDFGGGPVNTFSTDTVLARLDVATDESGTIPIEMVVRRLRTEVPVDFGAGLDFHYLTLQSERGGPPSTGTMTITFCPEPDPPPPSQPDHGPFEWTIEMAFDIRKGSPTGPIVLSNTITLTANGSWSHFPPDMAVLIPGVNSFLNGQDEGNDFWPIGEFETDFERLRAALLP